ncbi:hypothetical protein HN682_05235, partial [Candidatus Peregrinibacteria bacterium]|nr:hypothetical protein [Candidatus Peregrinibacteria bacterium]
MKRINIFLIFVFVLLAAAPALADVCSFKSECDSGETGVLSVYSLTNSHVSYYGYSETSLDLCCQGITASISDGCSDTYLISLSGTVSTTPFNQHAGDSTNYVNDVCLGNVNSCYMDATCGSDECIMSLSGTEDAHVGDCSAYTNKVCCVFDNTPPILTVTSPENTSYNQNNILIDFSSDDASNTLWYSNGTDSFTYTTATTITLADGNYNFTFFARDLANNEINESIAFSIDTVDPVFATSYHYSAQSQELTVIVADENLDSCWYVNTLDATVSVNCNDPFVFPGLEGLNTVIIWAKDVAGNVVNKEFTLTQDTQPPIFTTINNLTFTSQESVESLIVAEDVISEVGCFDVNDSRFEINCSGSLNSTALSKGVYWLDILVNDTQGNFNSEVIFVNITNLPPTITTIPKITFNEGAHYALNISRYVSDVDDAFSSLSIKFRGNNTIKVKYNPSTSIVNFTAPLLWQGSERITLNVSDSERYVEQSFIVEVGFGGCPSETRRCLDGTCDDECGSDEIETCDDDNTCDVGESCLCDDCLGEQSYCAADLICSGVSQFCVEEDFCSTTCDNICSDAECFGLDPDCDISGN